MADVDFAVIPDRILDFVEENDSDGIFVVGRELLLRGLAKPIGG